MYQVNICLNDLALLAMLFLLMISGLKLMDKYYYSASKMQWKNTLVFKQEVKCKCKQ